MAYSRLTFRPSKFKMEYYKTTNNIRFSIILKYVKIKGRYIIKTRALKELACLKAQALLFVIAINNLGTVAYQIATSFGPIIFANDTTFFWEKQQSFAVLDRPLIQYRMNLTIQYRIAYIMNWLKINKLCYIDF